MVASLPTELVGCIIDNLDPSDDRATLLDCALVGRAWVRASQRGIFHTILLNAPNLYLYDSVSTIDCFVKSIDRLMGLLDEKPVFVTYVLRLELQNFDGRETTSDDEKDTLCASVAGVVNRLSRVKKLSMSCFDWDHLTSMLRTALTGMLSAPSMTDLTLHLFTISTATNLISLLSHAVHLKALKALAVTFCEETSINYTGPPPGFTKLDTLVLGTLAFTFLPWFQQRSCLFRFENLRSLKIWVNFPRGLEMAAFLLQQAGCSLKELDLVRWSVESTTLENLLVYVPNLKSIRLIDVPQRDSYNPVPSILSLFKPLLSSDLTRYPLQHITLDLRVEYRVTMEWDSWSAFDALLEDPKFGSLRLVDDTTIPENLLVYVPNLKSIRLIDVPQRDSYNPVPSILSLFKPLLSSDLTRYPLQHITLDLRVEYRVTMEWDSWSAFDALLEDPKFGSLRLVDIVIKRCPPMHVSAVLHKSELETAAEAAVEKLRGNLPFLERSEKLKISFK